MYSACNNYCSGIHNMLNVTITIAEYFLKYLIIFDLFPVGLKKRKFSAFYSLKPLEIFTLEI